MRGTGSELRETAIVALAYGGEAPVDTGAETALGFKGAHGNVWLWCEDFIASLPHSHGVHDYYDDFSSPCYDGQHSVILGGSFMSAGDVASVFARFHFRSVPATHHAYEILRIVRALVASGARYAASGSFDCMRVASPSLQDASASQSNSLEAQ